MSVFRLYNIRQVAHLTWNSAEKAECTMGMTVLQQCPNKEKTGMLFYYFKTKTHLQTLSLKFTCTFIHNILLLHNLHTQTLHIVCKSGCISELEAKAFHTFAMPLTICAQILRFVIRAVPESGFSVIIQNSKRCTCNFYILSCFLGVFW